MLLDYSDTFIYWLHEKWLASRMFEAIPVSTTNCKRPARMIIYIKLISFIRCTRKIHSTDPIPSGGSTPQGTRPKRDILTPEHPIILIHTVQPHLMTDCKPFYG